MTAPDAGLDYVLSVDGRDRPVRGARLGASLLAVLREELGETAAKGACEQGRCGSCSVLLDGRLVASCLVLAADAVDAEVVTVAGLTPEGGLSDVQRALLDHGAVQCGFCTPGMVVAVEALLAEDPAPAGPLVREALSGNLCRCTGYGRILAAVDAVAADRAGP